MIETFVELGICLYYAFEDWTISPEGEVLSFIIICFTLIAMVIIPISYILILRRSEEVLENDNEFKEIHGYLYDGIRTKTPLQKLYFATFMVRRIFYLAIAFCGPYIPQVF